jgi:hypothetical protein
MTSLPENFIDANGPHVGQISMCQPPLNCPFHGVEDFFPGGAESDRGFFPGKPLGPASQKVHVGFRQGMFSVSPRHHFDPYAAPGTVDPAHGINEKDCNIPEWHELELPWMKRVIPGSRTFTAGANRFAVCTGQDFNLQRRFLVWIEPKDISINKGLELLHAIQNSLQLHPGCLSCLEFLFGEETNTGIGQDALCHFLLFPLILFREITHQSLWESGKGPLLFAGLFHFSTGLEFTGLYP